MPMMDWIWHSWKPSKRIVTLGKIVEEYCLLKGKSKRNRIIFNMKNVPQENRGFKVKKQIIWAWQCTDKTIISYNIKSKEERRSNS